MGSLSLVFGALGTLNMANFAEGLVKYNVQALSITNKVYSVPQTINFGTIQYANELVGKFAEKPDHVSAVLGVGGFLLSLYFMNLSLKD